MRNFSNKAVVEFTHLTGLVTYKISQNIKQFKLTPTTSGVTPGIHIAHVFIEEGWSAFFDKI